MYKENELNKELNKSIGFLTKQLFFKVLALLSLLSGCLMFLKCVAFNMFLGVQPSNMELLIVFSGLYFSDIDK